MRRMPRVQIQRLIVLVCLIDDLRGNLLVERLLVLLLWRIKGECGGRLNVSDRY